MRVIQQMEPWIGEEEQRAVQEYLSSGGWLTEFQHAREFERELGRYIGSQYVSVVTNGTVGLFAALKAVGVEVGDEVIVPDFTMIATANAVVLAGASPVFVDVARDTLCLDLALTERAITPRTRAILLVSLNGRSPDMTAFAELAGRRGIALIEDAAQSLGSRHRGRHLGTFGVVGSFSFSSAKIITTGQGGALVTDDPDVIRKIRLIKDFGRESAGVDRHLSIGYNFKISDVQSVIGLEQMKKLPWRVERKKEIFALYCTGLAHVKGVEFLPTNLDDVAPWFIDILVPDPESLRAFLDGAGIKSRRFYPAIHAQPAYAASGDFPNSSYAEAHGLWLPSSSSLSNGDVQRVCMAIRDFFQRD